MFFFLLRSHYLYLIFNSPTTFGFWTSIDPVFDFRLVFILDWLPTKARESSLHYYFTQCLDKKRGIHAFLKDIRVNFNRNLNSTHRYHLYIKSICNTMKVIHPLHFNILLRTRRIRIFFLLFLYWQKLLPGGKGKQFE